MLKPALVPAALIALLLVVPAPAHGACGVATAKADYESPEIQLYSRGRGSLTSHLACLRATGKRAARRAVTARRGLGVDVRARGLRPLAVAVRTTMYDPDSDTRIVSRATVRRPHGQAAPAGPFTETRAAGSARRRLRGRDRRFTDGRTVKLSADPTASDSPPWVPACTGGPATWRTRPSSRCRRPPRRPGAGGHEGRALHPRKGARLELLGPEARAHAGRAGRPGRAALPPGKRVRSARCGLSVRSDREVAFVRGKRVGTLNVLTGARTDVAGTAFAASRTRLLVVAARRPAQPGRRARGGSGDGTGARGRLRLLARRHGRAAGEAVDVDASFRRGLRFGGMLVVSRHRRGGVLRRGPAAHARPRRPGMAASPTTGSSASIRTSGAARFRGLALLARRGRGADLEGLRVGAPVAQGRCRGARRRRAGRGHPGRAGRACRGQGRAARDRSQTCTSRRRTSTAIRRCSSGSRRSRPKPWRSSLRRRGWRSRRSGSRPLGWPQR